jgi:hypothetical protein
MFCHAKQAQSQTYNCIGDSLLDTRIHISYCSFSEHLQLLQWNGRADTVTDFDAKHQCLVAKIEAVGGGNCKILFVCVRRVVMMSLCGVVDCMKPSMTLCGECV